MIPKHFSLGRVHILWWPLKTLRGRLEIKRDRSRDGKQVMRDLIDWSIAYRFIEIKEAGLLHERGGDHIYGTSRSAPTRLGCRFRQSISIKWGSCNAGIAWAGYPGILWAIRKGHHDWDIESAWHDAAASEYWYRHDKDYGDRDEASHRALIESEIDF